MFPHIRSTVLALSIAAFPLIPATAQHDHGSTSEILTPVHQLFDAMRAGDSTGVRNAFHPIARIVSTFTDDAGPAHRIGSVDGFVKAVGTPHDEVWDERVWDIEMDVQDNLASVWMQYAFFLGDSLSHCGVNSFQIFATNEGWKIMHLADTRQRVGCEVPAEDEM